LELVVATISDVKSECDGRSFSYARKAMICTSLACDVNREWHIGQLLGSKIVRDY